MDDNVVLHKLNLQYGLKIHACMCLQSIYYAAHVDLFSRGLHILSLESLEASLGDLDMGDESVQLVDAILVLVPEPGQADPHPEGDAPHALGPDGLVQPGVDPHVLGSHLLLCKLLDLLNANKCYCMSI